MGKVSRFVGEFASKGMSEGGVMGAVGALPSAVNDALAPFGVVVDRQPLSPIYLRELLRGRTNKANKEQL